MPDITLGSFFLASFLTIERREFLGGNPLRIFLGDRSFVGSNRIRYFVKCYKTKSHSTPHPGIVGP
eukprot:scaffold6355_cov119-Cylindrotheca_fusiformis.AAC.11